MTIFTRYAAPLAALAFALPGCTDRHRGAPVLETNFPGQVSAGGGTSGDVIARAPRTREVSEPSGTPGIPHGSGGNTSGAALGGTAGGSSIASSGQEARAPTTTPEQDRAVAEKKKADTAAEAERQKVLLAESMERITQRVRNRPAPPSRP